MASRIRLFLLKVVITSAVSVIFFSSAVNATDETISPLKTQSEQLIQPELHRRKVELADIDTEDFEVSVYTGLLSVEDFGVKPVLGVRLAYHINEDLFVEGAFAKSEAGKTSWERISGGALLFNDRNITYYNVSLGFNILPGEAFLTRKHAFNTALYIIGGFGSTSFAGDDRLTINFGGGFRILTTDWLAIHVDVRDHLFNINDVLGEDKMANNLEVTFGVSAFF